MKERFYLFKPTASTMWKMAPMVSQHSLKTRDGTEARQIMHAKNEAFRCPTLNVALAKVYLSAHDSKTSLNIPGRM